MWITKGAVLIRGNAAHLNLQVSPHLTLYINPFHSLTLFPYPSPPQKKKNTGKPDVFYVFRGYIKIVVVLN